MALNWKEELAKITLGQIVGGVILLAGFLVLIVWREALAATWAQATAALPTRVLSALLGLALITIGIETIAVAYLLYLVYQSRKIKPAPKPVRRFGLHWDSDHNPLCPVCDILMSISNTIREPEKVNRVFDILRCPKCKTEIVPKEDDGTRLMLDRVKGYLRGENADPSSPE